MSKVIIIGGGFAGLSAAKDLSNTNFDVTLIDKTNHHLFQPLLYQVATSALSPGDIGTPIREIVQKSKNITTLMAEVIGVDPSAKTITLATNETLSFDYLILATGARHSYFGNTTWETFAPGLKTIKDALKIREQILISFEKAERLALSENIEKYLNFVVIGAGPTGVEMAGAIAEVANTTLLDNFRRIKPESSHIYLLEAAEFILPMYPQKLSVRAKEDLQKLGVTVLTGKKVTDINAKGVQMEDRFIESTNIIWAAGNEAPQLLNTLGVPQDRQRRVLVEKDLSIPSYPNIFVIGDSSHAKGPDDKPLPGVAQTAIQQGRYVANLIKKQSPTRKPFVYFDKGSMSTIGKFKAVAMVRKFTFSGFLAWSAWCFIHILYLIGFRNRFIVLFKWLILFITGKRGVRLINRSLDADILNKNP